MASSPELTYNLLKEDILIQYMLTNYLSMGNPQKFLPCHYVHHITSMVPLHIA